MGLKHETLMIWRAPKHCTPPHLFFFSFFHLLRNSGCHRPCRADLFVRQNSRDLAEKHHQADSQRVSPGGGGVWTPTRDILLRWRAVNKHALPQGFANQGTERGKNNLKCLSIWIMQDANANISQITPYNDSHSQFSLLDCNAGLFI